jgi:hypothetical protein
MTMGSTHLEAYRARLHKMNDQELIREGKAGRYMCSPMAKFGKLPRRAFVIQLEEVKSEWRRRLEVSDGTKTADRAVQVRRRAEHGNRE